MPDLDVTELLSDPTFVQPLTLIHRAVSVDTFGETQLKESGLPTAGCVQPASGKTIQRLPEKFQVADVRSFWLRGKIISDSTCKYPDIIVKNGERFEVQVVFPWTDYGAGYSEGTCVRERMIAK